MNTFLQIQKKLDQRNTPNMMNARNDIGVSFVSISSNVYIVSPRPPCRYNASPKQL